LSLLANVIDRFTKKKNVLFFVHRYQFQSSEPVQFAVAAQKEAQVAHRVHQPPDIRAGETIPVPEVPIAGRQGRDRVQPGPDKRAGHHVVPEPPGQDEAGLRGTEEGPGDAGRAQRAQDILGDGPEHGNTQEETATGIGRVSRVRFAHRSPVAATAAAAAGQVRRMNGSSVIARQVYIVII